MDVAYAVVPFFAWLVAGSTKFVINSIKARQLAFGKIGYGGLPSTHSAIVSSVVVLVALRDGIDNPAFAVAVALALVVMLDAASLRRHVGKHAEAINKLNAENEIMPLRERMGHTLLEVGAGVVVGCITAWCIDQLF